VPYLIEEIEHYFNPCQHDFAFGIWSCLYDFAPAAILKWVPEPVPVHERCLNSIILLGELGPVADAAVPGLIRALDDEPLRCSAVLTLQAIGPAARLAVPKMLQLLSEDPDFRIPTALAILAPDQPAVIRTLARVSQAGPEDIRREAAAALKTCETKLASSLALLKSQATVMNAP